MKNKFYFLKMTFCCLFLSMILIFMYGCQNQLEMGYEGFPHLSGPYLDQQPPGENLVVFAPGIITT